LSATDSHALDALRDAVASGEVAPTAEAYVPPIPNIDKWYAPEIVGRLASIRAFRRAEQTQWQDALANDETCGLLPASTRTFLSDLTEAVAADDSAGFRRRQMPAVLHRYFAGMARVLHNVRDQMMAGASIWLVVGDSRTTIGGHTRTIPTIDEVEAIAKMAGFEPIERISITVTREDVVHSRNAITDNVILHLVNA